MWAYIEDNIDSVHRNRKAVWNPKSVVYVN